MYFYLIGVDYKSAKLSAREEVYQKYKDIACFWGEHAALFSTCNRMEVYAAAPDPDSGISRINQFFRQFPDIRKYAYIKYGEREVFRHALRLASGLESQLQGELQIFAQIKAWHVEKPLPFGLLELWSRALLLAEFIRFACGLKENNLNLADVVFYDLDKRIPSKAPVQIIVIGTGKIAQLIARLRHKQANLSFVAHKNYRQAKELAGYSGGEAFNLDELPRLIPKADVLISATKSPHYILKARDLRRLTGGRRNPLYVYDLAFPRDIEPDTGDAKGFFLQDLDDLNEVFQHFNHLNQGRLSLASDLIEEALEKHAKARYAY